MARTSPGSQMSNTVCLPMTYTSLKNTQKCWSITMIQSLPVDSFKLNCTILGVILKKDKDATGNGKSLVTVMKLGGLIPQRMKMLAVQTSGLRWPKGYNPQLTTFRPWRQAWRRYAMQSLDYQRLPPCLNVQISQVFLDTPGLVGLLASLLVVYLLILYPNMFIVSLS